MAQITAKLESGMVVQLSNGRHEWTADEPLDAGGQPRDGLDPNGSAASLDQADVRPVEPSRGGEILLRHTGRLACLSDLPSKLNGVFAAGHRWSQRYR